MPDSDEIVESTPATPEGMVEDTFPTMPDEPNEYGVGEAVITDEDKYEDGDEVVAAPYDYAEERERIEANENTMVDVKPNESVSVKVTKPEPVSYLSAQTVREMERGAAKLKERNVYTGMRIPVPVEKE